MLSKNDIYETEITSYGSDGSGVCKINGIAVFVPFTVRGDRIRLRIVKVCKTYAYGKTEEILIPSENRVQPSCKVFGRCGGCNLMHMSYTEQLTFKQNHVKDCIERIGGIDTEVLPTLGADRLGGCRNKIQIPVSYDENGRIAAGFYLPRSHKPVAQDNCVIQPPCAREIITTVCNLMEKHKILPYCEEKHSGTVRHIYIRTSEITKKIMAVLVINAKKMPCESEFAAALKNIGVTSFLINVNTEKTNVILGKKFISVYGTEKITDTLCGLKFEISPNSFYQINHDQAEKLYALAAEFADINKNDTVLDLYCGAGTITLFAAGLAKKAIGIEIVPEAIENAKNNMRINGIKNAEFYCGDAGKTARKLLSQGTRPNKIIIDPPRKGCDENTLNLITELSPDKVVYVSCNPATLARDLKFMKNHGYITEKIRPVDMFIHSAHVETVSLISRG